MVLKATDENEEVFFNVHKAVVGSQSAVLKAMFEVIILLNLLKAHLCYNW